MQARTSIAIAIAIAARYERSTFMVRARFNAILTCTYCTTIEFLCPPPVYKPA